MSSLHTHARKLRKLIVTVFNGNKNIVAQISDLLLNSLAHGLKSL